MRPYILYGQPELSRIITIIDPAVSRWENKWFGSPSFASRCSQATATADAAEWWYAKPKTGSGLFIRKPPGLIKAATLAVFGRLPKSAGLGDTPSPIVGDCLANLITDLSASVLNALCPSSATDSVRLITLAPDSAYFAAGSGTLQLQLHSPAVTFDLLIPSAQIASFLRKGPAEKSAAASASLENSMPMIHKHTFKLAALLGQAELNIGTLQNIAVGDVIRFDTSIDQTITLVTPDGTPVASGYLGTRDHFKSLQIAR